MRGTHTAVLVTILILAIDFVGSPLAFGAAGPVGDRLFNNTDNDQPVEVIEWAMGRFEAAGLDLPSLDFHFYPYEPTLEACQGHGGYHRVRGDRHQLDICAVGLRSRRQLTLHELAHAWAYRQLDEADRRAFVEHRHLDGWADGHLEWEDRGTEHAAEVIAWGLNARCSATNMLVGESDGSLADAFKHLTGLDPICEQR